VRYLNSNQPGAQCTTMEMSFSAQAMSKCLNCDMITVHPTMISDMMSLISPDFLDQRFTLVVKYYQHLSGRAGFTTSISAGLPRTVHSALTLAQIKVAGDVIATNDQRRRHETYASSTRCVIKTCIFCIHERILSCTWSGYHSTQSKHFSLYYASMLRFHSIMATA
jgi:hypothetical protein